MLLVDSENASRDVPEADEGRYKKLCCTFRYVILFQE
jgi:hypothetical protein